MFGGINQKNSQVSLGGITRHQTRDWLQKFLDNQINLINISPQQSDTTLDARWLPIIPGTDTAMMLGIAHFLETRDLVDRDFVTRCTEGYGVFREYLLGELDGTPKNTRWAAEICGIDEIKIEEVATLMATTRCLITVAWSLQRAEFGEQPFWMATTLAAMLGQIGLPGGGIGYGYGAIAGVGNAYKILKSLSLPEGVNGVSEHIPVARIADMLLHGGEAYEFNGAKRKYPNIDLIYWCGGNPFHHHQDLNRLRLAWQKPKTVIVHEPWWTSTAKHADIVFPATTPYEREDLSYAQGDSFLFHMPQLIQPIGDARNDYDIFSDLAKRLDVEEVFTEGRGSEEWPEHIYANFCKSNSDPLVELPNLSELRERNWVELDISKNNGGQEPFSNFREDPIANPLKTPSGRIEIFSSTIESFGYDDCIGHPKWYEPSEWLGEKNLGKFPLHMVSPQPADKLHSQMECVIADIEGARPAPLKINPVDAVARSLNEGDIARAFNNRGTALVKILISDSIREGVVSLCTGAWFSLDRNGIEQQGNPNVLTKDQGTSRLGQGSTAHTALVQVEALCEK
jgi:biotin/methionine sulfoxide reductase